MRINKFIASNSQHSRRKADQLIESGKVFVNEKKVTEHGIQINPEKDKVKVENQIIIPEKIETVYFALNKPADYVTTRNDEFDRKTVMDLLPKIPNLKPIGRLDKNTEGLLLFSNDGEFIHKLTHPKFECEKEYLVETEKAPDKKDLKKLEVGIKIDGKKTSPAKVQIIEENKSSTKVRITIHEGRNRQIRKMFASINCPVKYLLRCRIGDIKLSSLKKGKFRKLTKEEINAF